LALQRGRALRQYPWMDGDIKTDVCVIGGGVTGVLCALRLIEAGRSVVLLSRSPVGYGATSRLMPCSLCDCGQELRVLYRKMGRDSALRLLELTRDAADELEELCAQLSGTVGFARRDCVVYASSDTEAERLRRDYTEYRRSGFACIGMDRGAFAGAFAFPAAGALMISGGAVELDPYELTQHAAARAWEAGAVIFENTSAERISPMEKGGVKIYTSTHRQVTAGCAVIAAGAACAELTGGIALGRTRYIAACPAAQGFRGWPGRCVVRSAGEPGIICSSSPDGRVYISSEASPAADGRERLRGALHMPSASEKRSKELEDAARYLFPETGIKKYDAGWSFRGLRTADGLPVVGSPQGQAGCLMAVSGGEGGVLLSALLSRMIAEELCGRESRDMAMFSPTRRRLAG